ncbi:uncharacterized protein LOC105438612 [Strongylocentrotus purpuratus]|uniref:Uncharacterized protein n=1 Tax=Strongylocentrotus purpuratus TaxID=7668 RepID=A0A7M7PBF9_STRPU|nr:uncharacterized protein LOC105438612 [Strongylocentrotus purpuratus]
MSPPHYSLTNTEITCAKPGAGTNTRPVSGGRRNLNQDYTYSCKPGFTATSEELNTVCELSGNAPTGKWTKEPPTCEEITCAKPGAGTNTRPVSGGRRNLNQDYTYSCKPGFTATSEELNTVCELSGNAPTGKWTKEPPTCEEITCAKPGAGTNTRPVSGGRRNLNQDYTYSCKPGFTATSEELNTVCELSGNAPTGKWTKEPPTCEEITCAKPGAGTNTRPVSGGRRNLNQDYTYSCKPGFTATSEELNTVCELSGNAPTGKWTKEPPTCEEIICAKPGAGTNTIPVSGGRRNLNQDYTYSCKPGFTATSEELNTVCELSGNAPTGKWSKDPPTCEAERSSTQGTPLRCPRGFELFEGKYCFLIISKADIWEVQARKCKAKKGQLAIPRSEDKAEVLQRYHTENLRNDVWIGPQSLVVSNVFTDFELNRLSFTYFKNKRPERASGKGQGPDCVSVSAQNGKWTNECCYTRHPAICETGPIGDPECGDVSGYIFFQDRCLRFITNPDSFEAQCHECRRLKGRLAPSLNEAQNEALLAFYKSESPANGKPAWFNLHNLISSSNYQTTELLTSTFSKLPGRSSDSDRCVNIGSGGWGKECCHDKLPAVCELNRCPQHYIQSGDTCVRLLQTPDTWEASEKKCRKEGASLLVFRDASTRSQLLGLLGIGSTFVSEGSWIGCHDQVEEKKIQTPFLKDIGFSSQVSGNNAERDCCLLNSDGIAMGCCYEKLRAVCSLPLKK